jgi:hypothetical protein
MNETKPPETLPAEREILDVREEQAFLVSDNDIFNRAGSGYQHSDLPAYLCRERNHCPGKILRDNFRDRHLPPVKSLKGGKVNMLETVQVAMKLFY